MKNKFIKQAGLLSATALMAVAVSGTAAGSPFHNNFQTTEEALDYVMDLADDYPDVICTIGGQNPDGTRILRFNTFGVIGDFPIEFNVADPSEGLNVYEALSENCLSSESE